MNSSSSRRSAIVSRLHRSPSRNRSVAFSPPLRSPVGVQKFDIIHKLQLLSRANDKHCRVEECEPVPGHASMDNSSDGDSENCPVCLDTFTTQEVGTPDTCNHTFCAVCLEKWAKDQNNCPLDRQNFSFIYVRDRLGGKIIKRISVIQPRSQIQHVDDPEPHSLTENIMICTTLFIVFTIVICSRGRPYNYPLHRDL
jgi:hypothetical protein